MRKLKRWLKDIFNPESDMDVASIAEALNDPATRTAWLTNMLGEIKAMNMEVDRRLLSGNDFNLTVLCAKRKAYKDILESIPSARRTLAQEVRPNPREQVAVNLDRVTV